MSALTIEEKRELQLSELDILREFKRLCEANGLRYFMTAGTLLGAVRHQGFIPWDDDIDIAMPREDYNRLQAICERDLSPTFHFQSSTAEPNFPYYFSKIRKNGTEVYERNFDKVDIHKGHYIDVFPLDTCPRSRAVAVVFFKLIELLTCAYVGNVDSDFVCRYKKWYMRLLYRILVRFSLGKIQSMRDGLCALVAKLFHEQRLCTVGGIHGYPQESFDREWFADTVLLPFEGDLYCAPVGWHQQMTSMYGDYMRPPSEEEQMGHFRNVRDEEEKEDEE